jgi:programmed cell death 6-interacting protein
VGAIQQDPTPDMEPATLTVLADLMLAQAQEMVACKAMNDKMKDGIIAKLCAQCDELFSNVMRSMQKEEVKNLWDSDWLPVVSGKQAIYNGLAQYHQSKVCNEQKSIGEEIARLEYAKKLFTAGMERGSVGLCNAKDWLKKAERALTDARKDNDFIYHERIPEERQLAAVAKAAVAKPSPLSAKLGNPDAPELFDLLVPVAVHQALAQYDVRKSELVNNEVDKLKEATNLANQLLSSMNLPAALEDTKGNELPQSLKDKSTAVKDAGGTDIIRKLIEELPELLTRNTEILEECERLLKEEKDSDEQLRSQFKEKWNRTPSDKLTATFDSNAHKYRTIINNATQADKVVREKFDTHKPYIDMLSAGPISMESSVPSGGGSKTSGLPIAQKLREDLEDVETIKAERAVIESEIKGTKPDMKSVFTKLFAKDGVISEEQVSLESLGRALGSLQKQVGYFLGLSPKLRVVSCATPPSYRNDKLGVQYDSNCYFSYF